MQNEKDMDAGRPGGLSSDDGAASVSTLRASIPDVELREIATSFREGILRGGPSDWMCAAVCWPLASYLRGLYGIDCEAVEFDAGECNHVYIALADGRAIDPTLDQFNKWFPWKEYPAVYVGPNDDYLREWGLS